jgi:hypothetical protein
MITSAFVAARLAGGGVLEVAAAGEPDCYRELARQTVVASQS